MYEYKTHAGFCSADVDNMVGKRWSWDFDGGERVVIG